MGEASGRDVKGGEKGIERRLPRIVKRLEKFYGKPHELRRDDPFRVLLDFFLSQTTRDSIAEEAFRRLITIADSPRRLRAASLKQIEHAVRGVAFYRTKAKRLKLLAEMLASKFNYDVPYSRKRLLSLPGVGQKTAAGVLMYGFGVYSIPVDTHILTVSKRLGLVESGSSPSSVKRRLEEITPPESRYSLDQLFMSLGKDVCKLPTPDCGRCPIIDLCGYDRKVL